MSNAAPNGFQPTPEPVRRTATPWAYRPALHDDWGWIRGPQPDNGEIAPLVACARSGNWDDTATHDAHRAAGTDPYGANAAFIVEAVNSHASLKARAEQAERSVDVLESNARVQAKLLADTGRRAEELGALLEFWIYDGRLQTFEDRERFRKAARAALPQSSGVARAEQERGK